MSNKDHLYEYRRKVQADEPWCNVCNDSPGRCYNNADVVSGQWVECKHEDLTYQDFKEQMENIVWEIDQGPVDISEDRPSQKDFIIRQLQALIDIVK